ncbi:hypothetical protein [Lacticaseibacillus mingshuiensis]|uniref:Uncharacterized protein n=1 Tax=Lacticaseibacillus mingshuiensis TaxID=2799574 RepID=A0ABW4CK21_9LACO|nr:hypothetical protein [Lacticaseibacillus mingshuiensis]
MTAKNLRYTQTLNQFARLVPPLGDESRPISQQNLLFWVAAEKTPPRPAKSPRRWASARPL